MTFLLHEVQIQEEGYFNMRHNLLKTANVLIQEFFNFFKSELEHADF